MHEGHRERLREKYLKSGLDSFEDHEILELLLFYSIPRKNTNELAHALINKYGSLKAVLEADPYDIINESGAGKQSAVLLSLILDITKKYLKESKTSRPVILSSKQAGEYCMKLFVGENEEKVYLICLNKQYKVIHSELISEGSISQAVIFSDKAAKAALRHNAYYVVVTHNHPGGSKRPSKNDIETTERLKKTFEALGKKMIDHIIVGENGYYSFALDREFDLSNDAQQIYIAAEDYKHEPDNKKA